MNPFVVKVTCEVCGGDAIATPRDATSQWIVNRKFDGILVHVDPQICRDEIAYRERQRRKQETQLPQEADGG